MRNIIRDRQIVADSYQPIADDAPLVEGDIIISLVRWQSEQKNLAQHKGRLGIRISNTLAPEELRDKLQYFDLIALEFPAFGDGRAYTQARLLRERYHYKGELRAVGDVLRDQLYFMERCGFNAFEIRADKNLQDALNAFNEFTLTYQPGVDGPASAFLRNPDSKQASPR